jgi:hypothetical protein
MPARSRHTGGYKCVGLVLPRPKLMADTRGGSPLCATQAEAIRTMLAEGKRPTAIAPRPSMARSSMYLALEATQPTTLHLTTSAK